MPIPSPCGMFVVYKKNVLLMNRKKRNLQFIRTKNNLRLGKVSFFMSMKATHCYMDNWSGELLTKELDKGFKLAQKSLLKNYKLNYKNFPKSKLYIKISVIEDDLEKGLQTIVYELNLQGNVGR